ncbi:hypothetical protein BC940DRAFT_308176 [Gongronella butleri]|nr:hypothetical protein BC940DRAFT_308176 [Gongronella butleri]
METHDLLMKRLATASHNKIYPSMPPKSELPLRRILLATRLWNEVRRQQAMLLDAIQEDWPVSHDDLSDANSAPAPTFTFQDLANSPSSTSSPLDILTPLPSLFHSDDSGDNDDAADKLCVPVAAIAAELGDDNDNDDEIDEDDDDDDIAILDEDEDDDDDTTWAWIEDDHDIKDDKDEASPVTINAMEKANTTLLPGTPNNGDDAVIGHRDQAPMTGHESASAAIMCPLDDPTAADAADAAPALPISPSLSSSSTLVDENDQDTTTTAKKRKHPASYDADISRKRLKNSTFTCTSAAPSSTPSNDSSAGPATSTNPPTPPLLLSV